NLGVVPGTDIPVSVNTINNGYFLEGPCMNCEYFNQPIADGELWNLINYNDPYVNDIHTIQYDGYTDVSGEILVQVIEALS
ncbi:MAG: choice-of-anchor L domain-containing protein, partial [Flavobacteriales bacterium]